MGDKEQWTQKMPLNWRLSLVKWHSVGYWNAKYFCSHFPSILCNFIDTIRVFGVACKMILVLFITRIPRIIYIIILLFVAFSVYTFCMSTEKFSEPKLHDAWKCWRRVQTTPMSTIINQTKYKFRMIFFSCHCVG